MKKLEPGKLIAGKYLIQQELGSGAFGAVYKAIHEEIGRVVAIKILHLDHSVDEETTARFLREARTLSALDQANVIRIFSYGLEEHGLPYIAMEFLEGQSLASFLREQRESSGGHKQIPPALLLNIFIQSCAGVKAAHSAGIVHRDLKPDNIFLSQTALGLQVKILDFGLSRHNASVGSESNGQQQLTRTGELLGSVHYMSPEACRGAKVDERGDIYSLGCILFECITGKIPFDADYPLGILHKHVNEPIPEIPAQLISPELKGIELVIKKALQKDQDKRFQKTEDFSEALTCIQSGNIDQLESLTALDGSSSTSKFNSPLSGKRVAIYATLIFAGICLLLVIAQTMTSNKPKLLIQEPSSSKIARSSNRPHITASPEAQLREYGQFLNDEHSNLFNNEVKSSAQKIRAIEKELSRLQATLRSPAAKIACLYMRANALRDVDKWQESKECFEKAYELCKLPDGQYARDVIAVGTGLAETQFHMGDSKAEKTARECLQRLEKFEAMVDSGKEIPEIGFNKFYRAGSVRVSADISRSLLANIYFSRKDYKNAAIEAKKTAESFAETGINDGAIGMYMLVAECFILQNHRDLALKELDKFGESIHFTNPTKMRIKTDFDVRARANNTMHLYQNLADWFKSHNAADLAHKYLKKATALRTYIKESE